jgi:hypothetical protein
MPKSKTPTLHLNCEEVELPWRWEICARCDGHNRNCEHVESDGGGITASEMAELGPEFMEDYMNGVYDRPCPYCEGGKVKVADRSRMTKSQWRKYVAQQRDDADYEQMCRMERMMGA